MAGRCVCREQHGEEALFCHSDQRRWLVEAFQNAFDNQGAFIKNEVDLDVFGLEAIGENLSATTARNFFILTKE